MNTVPDDLVTVAVLQSDVEANIIKNQLESIGIKAYLSDEEAVAMAWQLAGAFGGIKLQVATSDAEDAQSFLERKPWQDEPVDKFAVATSETLVKMKEDEEEVLSEREKNGNRLARASVFGLLFLPIQFYALWLLVKVYFSSDKLEGRPRTNAILGGGITLVFFGGCFVAVVMLMRGPFEPYVNLAELPHPPILVGNWEGKIPGEKGEIKVAMNLRSVGMIQYSESGPDEIEGRGTWAYKDQVLLMRLDRFLKGNSSYKRKLLSYPMPEFKQSEMTLRFGGEPIRFVRLK